MIVTILGAIGLIGTTIFFTLWLNAERKLAEHNQSTIFEEVKGND